MSAPTRIASKTSPDLARFGRYQVVQDSIVPVTNIPIQRFDPWAEYQSAVGRSRLVEPPYVSLLNLAKNLRFEQSPFTLWQPSPEGKQEILEWCSKNGLLGVLPGMFREITLYPSWAKNQYGRWCVMTPRFVLANGLWYNMSVLERLETASEENLNAATEGELVPPDVVYANPQKPGALVWHWESHRTEHEDLTKSFYSFFPRSLKSDSNSGRYPALGSDEFWKEYGEPFHVFGRWATRFLEAAQILMAADLSLCANDQQFAPHHALVFMNSLATTGSASFEVELDSARIHRVHHSPALLVSFAEMFLRDMELGRRLTSCATCTGFFVAAGVEVRYCSNRCRNTMQRRRFRETHKTA